MTDERRRIDSPPKGYASYERPGEVRQLTKEFRDHIDDEEKHHGKVERSMESFKDRISEGEKNFIQAIERLEGRINGHRQIAIVAYMIAVGLGGLLMNTHLDSLDQIAHRVEETARVVASIDKRQSVWEKDATRWGNNIDKTNDAQQEQIEENEKDIRELRRAVRR